METQPRQALNNNSTDLNFVVLREKKSNPIIEASRSELNVYGDLNRPSSANIKILGMPSSLKAHPV